MFSFFKKKKIVPHIKLSGVIGNVGKFKQGIDFSGQEEIISKAFFNENAFLISSSCPAKSIPCLNFPAFPITPLSFKWATIFFFLKKENIFISYRIIY